MRPVGRLAAGLAAGLAALAVASAGAATAAAQTGPASGFGSPSLLFLPDEREALAFGRAPSAAEPEAGTPREAPAAEPPAAPATPPRLRLDGLFYLGPDRWSLWLDGERLDSGGGGLRPDVRVLAVSPDAVRLSWRPAGAAQAFRVLLRPNQVFDSALGRVRETGP